MSWINFFFFVIILNTMTGTVAYFLCKLLAGCAERAGAVRVVYPMYRMVQVFYIVPLGFLYMRFRHYFLLRTGVEGDLFWGNLAIRAVVLAGLGVWLIGVVITVLYYVRKYKGVLWVRWKNIPFRDERYMDILRYCYPKVRWKHVTLCTNFLLKSPCVMGTFRHDLAFPEITYSAEEIRVILMHEATHIARHDNLWKKIGVAIIIVNWFNPFLRWYMRDLDEWSDTACDIAVCERFFGGHAKHYFRILTAARTKGRSLIPPYVSQLSRKDSLKRRMERMIKWQKNGQKLFVSVLLAAVLVAGSSITALTASAQVVDGQQEWYQSTKSESYVGNEEEDLEIHVIPAEEVDEEKWENAIVYDEGLDVLAVQKSFDWTVPVGTFVRSPAFIKASGTTIVVSCYVHSDTYHHVGIRIPDGSMLYVNGKGQVAKTFPCDKTGTYYVYVENMGSTSVRAAGYYVR